MLMKFSLFVLLTICVVVHSASLYDSDDDDDDLNNEFRALTPQQLAELDEFLSRKLYDDEASSGEALYRNTRRPHEYEMAKRDALWTTTEVLDCVRRLKYSKDASKLDFTTEMLNCYRRLRRNGRG